MNTLAIDTSNEVLGLAVTQKHHILGEIITSANQDHSTRLMPAIVDLMEKTKMSVEELDTIMVTHGPGSYTGNRIGVTTAKTMAWGLNIPIYTVSSLALLAMNGVMTPYYICPFFNARRGSVFTGLYKWKNNRLVKLEKEQNILMKDWLTLVKKYQQPILFLSPDMPVFEQTIQEIVGLDAKIPSGSIHTSRPSNITLLSTWTNESIAHSIVPNYLRKTEAETNLLNKQKDEQNNG